MSWCIAWRYSNSFLLQNLPRETPSLSPSSIIIMSGKCADCNCNDPNKCDKPKEGSGYTVDIVETVKSHNSTLVMEDSFAENGGNCKCGPNCACTNCTCGA